MEIIQLALISKNNRKNGFYIYVPIVKKDGLFYFCHSVTYDKPMKKANINLTDLKLKREVPREYYEANRLT